mmetsp:Transcript_54473/g.117936  ORF Transcript_54473/g.117936 Transcript_54473/m.117936 type:complete len:163 (-) Transcript_54473:173-661(-)
MGLNILNNRQLMEHIVKEERCRWNHPSTVLQRSGKEAAQARSPPVSARTAGSDRSAALRFLEEKTGSSTDVADLDTPRPGTRELLYRGVSHDGEGRAEYLKQRRKHGVLERYGMPLTETQWYGQFSSDSNQYAASPNCRKPIIQRSFFRTMGVATYKDLPAA